jgi:hypothetical protein
VKIGIVKLAVEVSLRLAGYKRVVNFLNRLTKNSPPTQTIEDEVERHKLISYLAHNLFPIRRKCLARARSLWWLLKNKGIETDIKFGMRLEKNKLLAHAWVEHQGDLLVTCTRKITPSGRRESTKMTCTQLLDSFSRDSRTGVK